jgi:hypothetical protein
MLVSARFRPLAGRRKTGHYILVKAPRLLKVVIRHLAWQFVALLGAGGYVLSSNALPDTGAQVLAGLLLLTILALLVYRFVKVLRDPVGSVRWQPDD